VVYVPGKGRNEFSLTYGFFPDHLSEHNAFHRDAASGLSWYRRRLKMMIEAAFDFSRWRERQ
jgi:hypothetical protein